MGAMEHVGEIADTTIELTDRERERLARTAEMLPADAATCLEIGFKDQRVSSILARYDLVSIDLPGEAPASITHPLAFATIAALPFRDQSFDLAVCTEVLEHLEDDVLEDGVAELARVSRRHVLVSVPNRQRVWNELSKCPSCGYVVNAMGHLHHFDEARLEQLFPAFRPVRYAMAGSTEGYAPDWLYWLRTRVGNAWHPCTWGCFRCGSTTPSPPPNLIGKLAQRIVWRWEARAPRRPAFLFVLLERKDV
ncbi:class I SAM-dependent methyltransferase [Piscinibacter koreensis]|uniref:Methyltransferase domain-containing protein n=1 Tax=Piscinibacter koreensis TaxID=2742824 RepID=A0A7Y6NL95_9BURK|nr:class I SAM-dependent methyltransferase [Schlegelella koreensis]NUZ05167.1 methyltransferase domain-containing protein [Schlegelella koreensis]